MNGLIAVSLFAGIGGIDLALERAGIKVVAAVEIDPDCQAKLREHFPGVTLFGDVTEVTGDQLLAAGLVPRRGLLAAGWPCQGNSVAGGRGGMDDPRSGLWRHVVRLLAETRPRWFLGENVPGLLSVNGGTDIAVVRRDLAQLGYWWAERILDAQHFGVPQRRRRVFFVGCAGDRARPVQVLLEPESGDGDPAAGGAGRTGTAAASDGRTVGTLQAGSDGRRWRLGTDEAAGGQLIAHALTAEGADASEDGTGRGTPLVVAAPLTSGSHGHGVSAPGRRQEDDTNLVAFAWQAGGKNDASGAINTDGTTPTLPRSQTLAVASQATAVRRLTPLECERLQGFPDHWTAGQSDSTRYRQLGNAVAVPCVEWITRRIAAADQAVA